MPDEHPHITQLRQDLGFSRRQGPQYAVMTTQEAVREALLEIERLKLKLEDLCPPKKK